MGRTVYIVAPGTVVDAAVIAASNGAEIVHGVPPRFAGQYPNPIYPFAHTEPDDPEAAPLALAIAQLRSTFKTPRNLVQINNSLDAITLILKRVVGELR